MPPQKASIVPPGAGSQHFVMGDIVTVKVHGHQTGGLFSQIESTCGPQTGPPPHVHREDETFYVLEGEFEFVCAEEKLRGGRGAIVRLPRDVPHSFKNIGDTSGRVLVTMTPAGFEGFFAEVGDLTPEQQGDLPRVGEMAARYGLEFLPSA
jgi:quercetin dioxygenase-like cupin family protein